MKIIESFNNALQCNACRINIIMFIHFITGRTWTCLKNLIDQIEMFNFIEFFFIGFFFKSLLKFLDTFTRNLQCFKSEIQEIF